MADSDSESNAKSNAKSNTKSNAKSNTKSESFSVPGAVTRAIARNILGATLLSAPENAVLTPTHVLGGFVDLVAQSHNIAPRDAASHPIVRRAAAASSALKNGTCQNSAYNVAEARTLMKPFNCSAGARHTLAACADVLAAEIENDARKNSRNVFETIADDALGFMAFVAPL